MSSFLYKSKYLCISIFITINKKKNLIYDTLHTILRVIIISRTLDPIDNFNVSVNPYDHILSMVPGEFGVWVTLRGSSILELWDPKNLNCKLLYDTRTDRYPQLRKASKIIDKIHVQLNPWCFFSKL